MYAFHNPALRSAWGSSPRQVMGALFWALALAQLVGAQVAGYVMELRNPSDVDDMTLAQMVTYAKGLFADAYDQAPPPTPF